MATVIAYKHKSIAAGTYDPENMKRLCEILEVELPSEVRAVKTPELGNA